MTDLAPHDIHEEEPRLYKAREPIFPKAVTGTFRKLKWAILIVTLGIYYITPWIRWDRGPDLPDQAVLIDLANRRFFFFFIKIWPQEFYYVAGLLIMAGIGLFLFTSALGRVWCGYACPQTVWVDLYQYVERQIDGDRNAQIRLNKAPWTGAKIGKRLFKWAVWLLIAIATGGAWVFYFSDAPTLWGQIWSGTAPGVVYSTIAILTATTFIFGGFLREQVCIYMCPWPRIQGAMLDENSLVVTYKDWRGEPRGKHTKKAAAAGVPLGDCIDCNKCVAVCPMGIDIRDGQQLECITCALCIDACDGVMNKLGMEKGLIAYSTFEDYASNMQLAGAGGNMTELTSGEGYQHVVPQKVRGADGKLSEELRHTTWRTILRPRTFIYIALYAGIGLAMLTVLAMRGTLDVNVRHDRNPVFVTLSDGSIRNGYELKILNMRGGTRQFVVGTEGLPGSVIRQSGSDDPAAESLSVEVEADKVRAVRLFVTVPREEIGGARTDFDFTVKQIGGDDTASVTTRFDAPQELAK